MDNKNLLTGTTARKSAKDKVTEGIGLTLKTVTVTVYRLTKSDIAKATNQSVTEMQPTSPSTSCPIKKHIFQIHRTSRQAKDIHTPAKLQKTKNGGVARFTFAVHRLPQKAKRRYRFNCAVAGCGKYFSRVKDWNCHYLSKHQMIRFQCSICYKWMRTPNSLRDHMFTHKEKRFMVATAIRDLHSKVD